MVVTKELYYVYNIIVNNNASLYIYVANYAAL